ncbi:MAG: LysM peptidoglycan-binding domain-containing protein [Oligoflexales bacterium]
MKISGFKTVKNVGVALITLGLAFGCSSDQQEQEDDQMETSQEDTGEFGGDFTAADATLDASDDGSLGALPTGLEEAPVADAPAASGDFQQGDIFEYRVVRGDSLSAIAMRVYGSYSKWHDIQAVTNRPNPNLIYPGNIIRIPLSDAGALQWAQNHRHLQASADAMMNNSTASLGTMQTVTVQTGDTLSSLSQRYFGTTAQWRQILDQNSDVITDPNALPVGAELRISAPAH